MRAGGSGAAYAITGVGATIAAGGCCGCGFGGGACCCCCFGTSEGACVSAGASGIVDGGLDGGASGIVDGGLDGESRGGGEPASLDRDDAVSRYGDGRIRPARSPSLEAYPLLRSGADDRGRGAGEGSPPPAVSDFVSAFALPSLRNLTSFSISRMMVRTSLWAS